MPFVFYRVGLWGLVGLWLRVFWRHGGGLYVGLCSRLWGRLGVLGRVTVGLFVAKPS